MKSELLGCGHSEWLQNKLSLLPFKVRELCLFAFKVDNPLYSSVRDGACGHDQALGSDFLKNSQ